LEGEIGNLIALSAEAETRISALSIESLRLTERWREEAITELREIGLTEIELFERRASLAERFARLDVVAPASGTVFGSTVFTVGAVIQPAEPAMYVVPNDQPLLVSARIDAADIDNVFVGPGSLADVLRFRGTGHAGHSRDRCADRSRCDAGYRHGTVVLSGDDRARRGCPERG
jgi:hypothetical protein